MASNQLTRATFYIVLLSIGIALPCNIYAANLSDNVQPAQDATISEARDYAVADVDEVNARDTSIRKAIEAEAKVRQEALDEEVKARQKIVEAEAAARQLAIEAEASYRADADKNLQDQINKISSSRQYSIGEIGPAGGIVFFITDDKKHGLEAAPKDQNNGENIKWRNGTLVSTSAVVSGVNGGSFNTNRIIISHAEGRYAALVAANYHGGGYGDWYLPSKDELNLMYGNLHSSGEGNFANSGYWSSTENNSSTVWVQWFDDGRQHTYSKSGALRVRAIRAF